MTFWLLLVLTAGLIVLRIGFTHFGPIGDVYLLALVVGSAISWERWRRRRGGDLIALAEQLASADPIPPSEAAENPISQGEAQAQAAYLVFTYPSASRLRAYLTALFCTFFGVGFLLSLILDPTGDPANSWLLFGLGVLCLGALPWSIWQLVWIGASLALSPRELVHRSPRGRLTRLSWEALTRITRQRYPFSLTFWGTDHTTIRIYTPLAADAHLLRAIGRFVRRRPHAS
jgi:hypothetical protein